MPTNQLGGGKHLFIDAKSRRKSPEMTSILKHQNAQCFMNV